MKKVKFVLTIALIVSSFLMYAQTSNVNAEKSAIKWLGKKVGGEHSGEIQLKSGKIEVNKNEIVKGNFVIDMTSITNTDIENEEYKQKIVGHLKSDDFFGVEKYPTANFVITKAAKFVNGKAQVTGDLTIKGKTESISFEVVNGNHEYTATIEVDRSKFDIRYGSKSFFDNLGDKVINDIFILDLKLVM